MAASEGFDDLVSAHNDAVRIERLTHHIRHIRESQDKMEATLGKLAEAVSKLAVIEERQNQDRQATERAFAAIADMAKHHDASVARIMGRIERVEDRLIELERSDGLNKQARYWLFGAIGTGGAAIFYAIAKSIGLAK